MINNFLCTNIFSMNSAALIDFYQNKLGIPITSVIVDHTDGVNFGFAENAPTICIWDAQKWGYPASGATSFVFSTDHLDATVEELKKKGLDVEPPVRFDWGTYELRLKDPDGNEVVIVETQNE